MPRPSQKPAILKATRSAPSPAAAQAHLEHEGAAHPTDDAPTLSAGEALVLVPPTVPPRRPAGPATGSSGEQPVDPALERQYEALLAGAQRSRKKQNLANVWGALEHLRAIRSTDYSVASVARTIRALGAPGPQEQSIRNAEGKDFRDLILAYGARYGMAEREPASSEETIVAQITDQRLAAQVRALLHQNRSLRGRLDAAHAAFRKLAPLATAAGRTLGAGPEGTPGTPTFTSMELASVRAFLGNLPELDCHLDPVTSALRLSNGTEVAGPGFGNALRKVLSAEAP
jgi:hypothetical protein